MSSYSQIISLLKNNILINNKKCYIKNSKKIRMFLKILVKNGYIKYFKEYNNNIIIYLKYINNRTNVIKDIKQISKSGKRCYIGTKQLYRNKNKFYIISTNKGVLTTDQSLKYRIGGELLCQIYI